MAFWKVAGFTQPSPIESILDKEEFTLEELLDEDDIIQECKSLNGRLITFLKEKKTVEQLLRYLIEPPNDPDDPKKQYRYPFTACEVFCCEVEAVFNTLLEDEGLLQLLFSLLEQEPPLSCKSAGYFGRVVGQLLLRKTNEMMQHLSNNDAILEKLIKHVDTTSIADIIKRLVGADDHSSMIFLPMHTQWLSETPLISMLLDRLAPEYSAHVQSNAADILTAIAHTQPSALATQLMQQQSIAALFRRALAPGSKVLVTALDVCAALLEPRRAQQEPSPDGASPMPSTAGGSNSHSQAISSMLQYIPQLMEHLKEPQGEAAEEQQETPYGILAPPLGRARLRIVELLAALLRVGDDSVDAVLIGAGTMPLVQQLFVAYPFNNLLHHQTYELLVAGLRRSSRALIQHIFGECELVAWLANIPKEVNPNPRFGFEGKGPLRAGYLGHVTRIGQILQEAAAQQHDIADVLKECSDWQLFVQQELTPRLEVEDVTRWQCGRPVNTEGGELDSDGDEFQNDIDALEQIQGVPPGMYHRYGVLDDMDDDEDEAGEHSGDFSSNHIYSADMLVAGMAGLGVNDSTDEMEQPAASAADAAAGSEGEAAGGQNLGNIGNWSLLAHPGASSSAVDIPGERSMDDDAVLLADDEEMGALTASTLQGSPHAAGLDGGGIPASPPMDDSEIVMVDDVDAAVPLGATAEIEQQEVDAGAAVSGPAQATADEAVPTKHVGSDDDASASGISAAAEKSAASANPFAAAAGGSSAFDRHQQAEPETAHAVGEPSAVADSTGAAVESSPEACNSDSKYWPSSKSHPVHVADEVA